MKERLRMDPMSWELNLRRNQFKRKNVLVKMQLVDIQYWDVGRFDMLGFGMVNESRIVEINVLVL